MSYETFNIALETHIAANYFETPVQYENAPVAPFIAGEKEWIAVSTQFGGAEPRTFGSPAESHETGIVFFRVFIPDGAGSKRARALVDTVIAMISNQFVGDAYFYQAYAQVIGARESTAQSGGGYYQINVLAPFYRRIT